MKYAIYSVNEWLYPDSESAGNGKQAIELISARHARAGSQLLLQSLNAGTELEWSFEWTEASAAAASSIEWEVYRMRDVPVNENTGPRYSTIPVGTPADYVTRPAPFRVYDALEPIDRLFEATSETEALYVCCYIPASVPPATYGGTVSLIGGGSRIEIAVTLEIFAATIPHEESLHLTNWHSNKNVALYHGVEAWSEEHWAMLRRYGETMRRARQTHFLVDLELIGVQRDGSRYSFDFSRVKRYIELFLELGFTWIEGGHVACREGWTDATFVLSYDRSIQATKPEGFAYLSPLLTAWYRFLKQHGWDHRTVQHVADEPIAESADDFRILAGMVRKLMPGVPLIEAIIEPYIEGSIDIWVPTNEGYDNNREVFEALQALGETFWFYTCWNPGGHYLNRFMDIPLLKTRYLHWGNYKYGLTGYLHWGFNQYLNGQDPFELTCPQLAPGVHAKRVPAGDTHVVYPGKNGPLMSIRLEAMRAGVEDYELFRQLAAHNKQLADDIAASCMSSFTEVVTDTDAFDAAHRRLLEHASQYWSKAEQ